MVYIHYKSCIFNLAYRFSRYHTTAEGLLHDVQGFTHDEIADTKEYFYEK